VLAGLGAGFFAPTAAAKDIPLTAIELYDGPSGAAYVQLSGVLINSKAEMKDCTPFQNGPVDKSTYGKMGRIVLAAGGMLERGSEAFCATTPVPGSRTAWCRPMRASITALCIRSQGWPTRLCCKALRSLEALKLL